MHIEHTSTHSRNQTAEEFNSIRRELVTFSMQDFMRLVGPSKSQRPLNRAYARRLSKHIIKADSPPVSCLDLVPATGHSRSFDGKSKAQYVVIDGQHRANALMQYGNAINVPCIITRGSRIPEAAAFAIYNSKKPVDPNHIINLALGTKAQCIVALNSHRNTPLRGNVFLGRRGRKGQNMLTAIKIRTIMNKTHKQTSKTIFNSPIAQQMLGLPQSGLADALWKKYFIGFINEVYVLTNTDTKWRTISLVCALWQIYLRKQQFKITDLSVFAQMPLALVSCNETSNTAIHQALTQLISFLATKSDRKKWDVTNMQVTSFKFDINNY